MKLLIFAYLLIKPTTFLKSLISLVIISNFISNYFQFILMKFPDNYIT